MFISVHTLEEIIIVQTSQQQYHVILANLDTLFWVFNPLITESTEWYKSRNTIIQPCFNSHWLTFAFSCIKMVPNLNIKHRHISQDHSMISLETGQFAIYQSGRNIVTNSLISSSYINPFTLLYIILQSECYCNFLHTINDLLVYRPSHFKHR